MSAIFPQLNAQGVMVQRPYGQRPSFSTQIQDLPTGKRIAFSEWGGGLTWFPTGMLGRFDLQYPLIIDSELATLQAFFDSMEGKLGEFTFLDPGGNLVAYSDDFSNASWTGHFSGSTAADTFGGNRATTCSATTISTPVIPGGGASGFVLCGSIWAKPTSSGTVTVTLAGSSQAVTLAAGAWKRVFFTATVPSAAAVSVQFAVPAGAIFGAQCAASPGPGAYRRTPGMEALRPKCRFDSDDMVVRKIGPNQNAVTLSVAEYF